MHEKLSDFKKEQQAEAKRYILPEKNIIALDENSVIRQRNKRYRRGLHEAGIELPVEIQGSGISDPETREFKVCYPKGDVFASWAITVHELGHLRQAERHGYEKQEDIPENVDTEIDAWEIGLKRIKKFAPEVLGDLEKQFQEAKASGLLGSFTDFMRFFNYFKKMCISLRDAHEKVPENIEPLSEELGRLTAEEIKKDDEFLEFFTHQEKWKTGKIINQEEVERCIKIVAEKIAEEI